MLNNDIPTYVRWFNNFFRRTIQALRDEAWSTTRCQGPSCSHSRSSKCWKINTSQQSITLEGIIRSNICTCMGKSYQNTVELQWLELWWLIHHDWLELLSWSLQVILGIIHPGWLELPSPRTIFHGSKPVRAIEVIYCIRSWPWNSIFLVFLHYLTS